jgi:hypothetical protein
MKVLPLCETSIAVLPYCETSMTVYQWTRCNIPEDLSLQPDYTLSYLRRKIIHHSGSLQILEYYTYVYFKFVLGSVRSFAKGTINFGMSVRPHGPNRRIFMKFGIWDCSKIVEKIQVSLKS